MWKGKMVSVVVTSYREKDSIRGAINGLFEVPCVDEVVVVDNNAEPGSAEEVRKTKARLVFEKRQGHGWALQCGLREAKGDYVITFDGDGTFRAADVEKMLCYTDYVPVVFGTRTNQGAMEPGALGLGLWGVLRRWADILEGKLLEFLFMSPRLTDVGCTLGLLRKDVIKALDGHWTQGGMHFVTEMRTRVAAAKIPYVEIPVVFVCRNVGESYVVGTRWKLTKVGMALLVFIIGFWLRSKIFARDKFPVVHLQ